jgi:hypothetical protein
VSEQRPLCTRLERVALAVVLAHAVSGETEKACVPPRCLCKFTEVSCRQRWCERNRRVTMMPMKALGFPVSASDRANGHFDILDFVRFREGGKFSKEAPAEFFPKRENVFKGVSWANATCAIVGNSGTLNVKPYGKLIDAHDIVIRMNQAPTAGVRRSPPQYVVGTNNGVATAASFATNAADVRRSLFIRRSSSCGRPSISLSNRHMLTNLPWRRLRERLRLQNHDPAAQLHVVQQLRHCVEDQSVRLAVGAGRGAHRQPRRGGQSQLHWGT